MSLSRFAQTRTFRGAAWCVIVAMTLFSTPLPLLADPPVVNAGGDRQLQKNKTAGSDHRLDAPGTFDPDGDPLIQQWYGPFGIVPQAQPLVSLPEGSSAISLIVSDGDDPAVDTAIIEVVPCFALTARAKPGQVQLSFPVQSGAERYDVYRTGAASPVQFIKIGETTASSGVYLDTGRSNEQTYLYVVGAQTGGVGCYSTVAAARPTLQRGRVNAPPVVYSPPVEEAVTNLPYRYDVNAVDPNGDALTYALTGAPSEMKIDPVTGVVTWTPPQAGAMPVTVSVTDPSGGTATQAFTLTAEDISLNRRPKANAGVDRRVTQGESVVLDGSGSTDPDGDSLTYFWRLLAAPKDSAAQVFDPNSVKASFVADKPGDYVLELTVADADFANSDRLTVSSETGPPVARAGSDRTARIGDTVQLDGSASSDPDGDPLTYAWTLIRPAASQAQLSDAASYNPTLVIDKPGSYTARLVVKDAFVESEPDDVVISTINSKPVANAGPNQTVNIGDTVQLNGVGSNDADGDALTYMWALVAQPDASSAQISDVTSRSPTFVPDRPGLYVAQLIVNDGALDSDPDTMTATAEIVVGPNHPPVAQNDTYALNAGQSLHIGAPGVVANDSDADDDRLTAILVEPPGSGTVSLSAAGSFTYTPNSGPNRVDGFTYKVSDGKAESGVAEVSIEVSGTEIAISRVDTSGVLTNGQTLGVSGNVRVTVENQGSRPLTNLSIPFLAFEDRNNSGVFDEGDAVLGMSRLAGELPDGGSAAVDIPVDGETQFRDAPILVHTGGAETLRSARIRFAAAQGQPLPAVKWTWDDPKNSEGVLHAPVVAPLIDTNGDGRIDDKDVPAIIFTTYFNTVASQEPPRLVALRGDTGEEIFAVGDPDNQGWSYSTPAVGDLDGDGFPEILMSSFNQTKLWAFSNDGSLKWQIDPKNTNMPNAYLADTDADGVSEILYGAVSATQVLYADGTVKAQQSSTDPNRGYASEGDNRGSRVVADLDLDGIPEILAGAGAITADGKFLWGWRTIVVGGVQYQAQGRLDGGATQVSFNTQLGLQYPHIAVANVDDDAFPEIIAVATTSNSGAANLIGSALWIFEHDGRIHAGPFPLFESEVNVDYSVVGPPTVADLGGDGHPEIALSGVTRVTYDTFENRSGFFVRVYSRDGTLLWHKNLTAQDSVWNPGDYPLSAFDFDGDGAAELVVKDPHKLHILNGRDGSTLYELGLPFDIWNNAYVTVADVDNDGHAELVVPLHSNYLAGAKPRSGVLVIGDANGTWAPGRGVWNQWNYHVTNVEDDGGIPMRAKNPTTLRAQAIREGIERDWAPDLTIARIVVEEKGCAQGAASLAARVGNGGDLPARSGIKVHFFDGNPAAGASLLGVAKTTGTLFPGQFEDVSLACAAEPRVIFATVNSPLPAPPVPSSNLAQIPHTWAETSGAAYPYPGSGGVSGISVNHSGYNGIDGVEPAAFSQSLIWSSTVYGATNIDPRPPFYEVHFQFPVNPSSVTVLNVGSQGFLTGTLTFSNGFSTPAAFDANGRGTVTFPEQQGVRWIRLTAETVRGTGASLSEFIVGGTYVEPEFRIPEGEGRLANNIVACGEGIVPCNEGVNRPPAIVSAPPPTALVNKPYVYAVQASDPDGDALTYSLDLSPSGMSINGSTGRITWTPPVVQLGEQVAMVRVQDPRGFFDAQSFTVRVASAVTVPDVTGKPQNAAEAAIAAAQLKPGAIATEASDTVPTGSVARQSPAPGTEVAQDSSVDLVVSAGRAPVADAGPDGVVDEAEVAVLNGSASSDPDGQPLTYAWSQVTGTAVTLSDPSSPQPSFTAPQTFVGSPLTFRLQVSDGRLTATDEVTVTVRNTLNDPPTADSGDNVYIPSARTVSLDGSFSSDPNGQPITYAWTLLARPSGSTAALSDPAAQKPTFRADKVGQYLFQLIVSDGELSSAPDTVLVNLQDGRFLPTAQIRALEAIGDVGGTTTLKVVAGDDVGVGSVTVTVDGVKVPVDANGYATFPTPASGNYNAEVAVTDVGGNVKTDAITVRAMERGPVVEITSPEDGAVITSFTDILGTAADGTLVDYTLSVAPVDGTFTEVARGKQPVKDGVLATFDPTLLTDGSYTLRLAATDGSGNQSTVERHIEIAGELKLGNFRLTFEDLSLPVAGVPITVRRTYDTLQARASRDVGFGWRLDVIDAQLHTSVPKTGFESELIFNGFIAGTGPTGKGGSRVYITRSDGKREGFTFKPKLAGGLRGGFLKIFLPEFVPDPGVKGKLAVREVDLSINTEAGSEGRVFPYGVSSIPYNPANPELGGSYTYMTEDGLIYTISGLTGKTTSVRDGSGNTLTVSNSGVTSSTGDKVTFERDAKGRITGVVDPLGHRIRYEYDAKGDLVRVTDRENNATQFVYRTDRPHYLERIIDPLNRPVARTEYDERGRLVGLLDAAGNRVAFDHLTADRTEVVRDALGHPTSYVYDDRGNVLKQIDALGGVISRTYDANNNMLTETNQLGHTTTFAYDDRSNTTSETDPLGNKTKYSYLTITPGGFGFKSLFYDLPSSAVDPSGRVTKATYDFRAGDIRSISDQIGNTTEISYSPDRLPLAIIFPNGGKMAFAYDLKGRLRSQTDAYGNSVQITEDAAGNRLSETRQVTTSSGRRLVSTTMEYDAEGRLLAITDPEGNVSRTEYDKVGNRTGLVDPLGRRTTFHYDHANRLTATVFADGSSRLVEYDGLGRVTAETDEANATKRYVYDALGRRTEVILPDATPGDLSDNPRSRFEFDAAGRVIAEVSPSGRRTTNEFDAAGRLIRVRDAAGSVTSMTYDPSGKTLAVTDPLGRATNFAYDAAGRLTTTMLADGSALVRTLDSQGRAVAFSDQKGDTTEYEYDAFGQLIAVTDAENGRTTYTYNEDGGPLSRTDALGRTTSYGYDTLGRMVSVTLPDGRTAQMTHDKVGNLASYTDFGGNRTQYSYDNRNRPVSVSFPDGRLRQFAYTPTGQVATAHDDLDSVTLSYDSLGQLVRRIDSNGMTIEYAYDSDGNRTSVRGLSAATTYTYDQMGRLKTVSDSAGGVTSYAYDAAGNLVQTAMPNGTTIARSYDALNRLIAISHRNPSGDVIAAYQYTLDPNGNRLTVEDHSGELTTYTYDRLERLLEERTSLRDGTVARSIGYIYDAAGNLIRRSASTGGNTNFVYDLTDQVQSQTSGGVTTNYVYDPNGNLIRKSLASGRTAEEFLWDAENRLIGIDSNGDGTQDLRFEYDFAGNRIAETRGDTRTRFNVDVQPAISNVLEEVDAHNDVRSSYVRGRDLIARQAADLVAFYHADALGSTRALTQPDGHVTDRYAYDAFGGLRTRTGASDNPYLFAGERHEAGTPFYNLRARELDTGSGRFMSRDPFGGIPGRPISANPYLYADANPVNRIDPLGLLSLGELAQSLGIQGYLRAATAQKISDTIPYLKAFLAFIGAVTAWWNFLFSGLNGEFPAGGTANFEIFQCPKLLCTKDSLFTKVSIRAGTKQLGEGYADFAFDIDRSVVTVEMRNRLPFDVNPFAVKWEEFSGQVGGGIRLFPPRGNSLEDYFSAEIKPRYEYWPTIKTSVGVEFKAWRFRYSQKWFECDLFKKKCGMGGSPLL